MAFRCVVLVLQEMRTPLHATQEAFLPSHDFELLISTLALHYPFQSIHHGYNSHLVLLSLELLSPQTPIILKC